MLNDRCVADGRKFLQEQYSGRGAEESLIERVVGARKNMLNERGALRFGPGKTTEKEEESDEKAKEHRESKRCSKMEPEGQEGGVAVPQPQSAAGCAG